jgi:hypothetical protein
MRWTKAVVQDVTTVACIDVARVYAVGFSMQRSRWSEPEGDLYSPVEHLRRVCAHIVAPTQQARRFRVGGGSA